MAKFSEVLHDLMLVCITSELPGSWLETGLDEINGDFLEAD
jgi:hypothetical protein